MMKHEFEERLGKQIEQELYEKIEVVYTWYPCQKEIAFDKDYIVNLYDTFGVRIIDDMYNRASKAMNLHKEFNNLKSEIEILKENIGRL